MENKRLTNKLNSWFWFILSALPIIVLLIIFIFALPQCAKNFDWVNNSFLDFIDTNIDDTDIYADVFNSFDNFSIPYISNTFSQLFLRTFHINSNSTITYLFSWLLSVQIYHLIYDVLKFIIEWCHNLIEKAY